MTIAEALDSLNATCNVSGGLSLMSSFVAVDVL
jgi:hypothetical protein